MNNDNLSIADTLIAKTDQLNADNLMLGPLVVEVMSVRKLSSPKKGEQPLIIGIDGGRQPWKPCLSMRRVLAAMWGAENAREWVGRRLKLFRDASVTFGDQGQVGGIRIAAASHINVPFEMPLTVTRGQKRMYRVDVLRVEQPKPRAVPDDDAPAPNADDFRQSVRLHLREIGADMAGFLEFVQAKTNKDPGPPDTWNERTAKYLAGKVRGEWAADLRTYLAPPVQDDDNPFDGDAA